MLREARFKNPGWSGAVGARALLSREVAARLIPHVRSHRFFLRSCLESRLSWYAPTAD
jgi:hypothetical protein